MLLFTYIYMNINGRLLLAEASSDRRPAAFYILSLFSYFEQWYNNIYIELEKKKPNEKKNILLLCYFYDITNTHVYIHTGGAKSRKQKTNQ